MLYSLPAGLPQRSQRLKEVVKASFWLLAAQLQFLEFNQLSQATLLHIICSTTSMAEGQRMIHGIILFVGFHNEINTELNCDRMFLFVPV
jgi:hypothetical protein